MSTALNPGVVGVLGGVFALLATATLALFGLRNRVSAKDHAELQQRVRTWWVIVGLFVVVLLLGRAATLVFLALVSFMALREYLSLVPTRRVDRRLLFWVYLAIPVQYFWVGVEWYGMFIIFVPIYLFLMLPVGMIVAGVPQGFLHAAGTLQWGLMATVFSLSHLGYLLVLPAEGNHPDISGAGLLVCVMVLTEFNDVAQYIWGKSFGRHRITPVISPNKTWEGFAGGVLSTVVASLLLSPLLTPFSHWHALLAGLLIGIGGFFGDVTISALKRDLNVKDSGTLLPGHGGILDRIDSLCFTAPLFFHFSRYLYF